MHRCQARGLKAVTLYSSKPKKKKNRYGAEEGPLTDQEQCKCKTPSEWRVPKIAWSTLVHQESFSTCHRYKPQPCCQFWMARSKAWLRQELEATILSEETAASSWHKVLQQGLITPPHAEARATYRRLAKSQPRASTSCLPLSSYPHI